MSEGHGTFATALNCMDGRTQIPVIEWVKKEFHVDYVDTITEPGIDAVLASGNEGGEKSVDEWQGILRDSVRRRIGISTGKHLSKAIVIVGHDGCAGNPVDKEQHLVHIRSAVDLVKSWVASEITVLGLWCATDDSGNWQVTKI